MQCGLELIKHPHECIHFYWHKFFFELPRYMCFLYFIFVILEKYFGPLCEHLWNWILKDFAMKVIAIIKNSQRSWVWKRSGNSREVKRTHSNSFESVELKGTQRNSKEALIEQSEGKFQKSEKKYKENISTSAQKGHFQRSNNILYRAYRIRATVCK